MRGGSSENPTETEIGFLHKKGRYNTSYKKRFIKVITNNTGEKFITYSENQNSPEKGQIPVESVEYTYMQRLSDSEILLKIKTSDREWHFKGPEENIEILNDNLLD